MGKDKMNNKELTELKKEFEQMFYTEVAPSLNPNAEPPYNASQKVDVFWNKKPSEVWNFFLPHLKSNDDIKREAYILGYKAGWGDDAVYKTNGELEKEAKESFDGNKSLLGLTQKESNE